MINIPPIFYLCVSFILGIFLSANLPVLDYRPLISSTIGLSIIALIFRRDQVVKVVALSVMVLVLGILRYQTYVTNPYNEEFIGNHHVKGMVSSQPVLKGTKQQFELVTNLNMGKILVTTTRYPEYNYGDIMELNGKLKKPPEFEQFSYKEYLANKGIYYLSSYPEITKLGEGGNRLYKGVLSLRKRFESSADKIFPEPEASLLVGTVVGIEREIPKEFNDALKRSGTLHVVVVSGFNITVVILFFMTVLSFLGRNKSLMLSFLGIAFYILLVGFNPPVIRAALMGYIALLGKLFGRQREALLSLFLSAALIIFLSPLSLKSLGFQLSFSATLGILLIQRPIYGAFNAVPKLFREAFSTTLAAMLFVSPILIYNFQTFSVVAPLANILIFWTIPAIMGLGGMTTVVGMAFGSLGRVLGVFAYIPMLYFVEVVEALGSFTLASVSVPKGSWLVWVGYYGVLFIVISWQKIHSVLTHLAGWTRSRNVTK